jgi:hypothetical protein
MSAPRLPILSGDDNNHPEWRQYLDWVYGEGVPTGKEIDLNTFSWFYWASPLGTELRPLQQNVLWTRMAPPLALSTAWTCSLPFKPECSFSQYGFFVSREQPEETVEAWTKAGRIEVARIKFHETGAAWFYHAVGSGVFLNLDALPVSGQAMVHSGDLPDLGLWDGGIGAYMKERDCNLLIIVDRFPNRMVEIVVRAASLDTPLDTTCPLSESVFSTGLSAKQPCVCSDDVKISNCRHDVSSILKTYKSSLWTDFFLDILVYIVVSVALVGGVVAIASQVSGD